MILVCGNKRMAASKAMGSKTSKAKSKASVPKHPKAAKAVSQPANVAKNVAAKKKSAMKSTAKTSKAAKPAAKPAAKKLQPSAKKPAKPAVLRVSEKPKAAPVKPPAAPARAAAAAKPAMVVEAAAPAAVVAAVAPNAVAAPSVVTAPRPAAAAAMPVRPALPKAVVAQGMVQAAKKPALKPANARNGFKTNEFIVYPAHGVGRIVAIEEQEIAGIKLELFVIQFEKDKMTLRVPTGKCQSVGMRKLAEDVTVRRAMETLKGRARIKRTMWSRRAQEYEAKINSGDLVAIAEVVRDLYRSENQPEQSYSERQLYEAALDRMAREIAAVDKIDERSAVQKIVEVLSRSAKARKPVGEDAAPEAGDFKAA